MLQYTDGKFDIVFFVVNVIFVGNKRFVRELHVMT